MAVIASVCKAVQTSLCRSIPEKKGATKVENLPLRIIMFNTTEKPGKGSTEVITKDNAQSAAFHCRDCLFGSLERVSFCFASGIYLKGGKKRIARGNKNEMNGR